MEIVIHAHIDISHVTFPLPPFHLPSSIESYKLSSLLWKPQASAAMLLGSAHQCCFGLQSVCNAGVSAAMLADGGLDSTLLRAQTHLAPHFNAKVLPASQFCRLWLQS